MALYSMYTLKISLFKRWNDYLPIFIILAAVGVITYSYRWIFTYKYQPVQEEYLLEHSQYVWPRGNAVLDDNLYYKIVGYKLVDGANPFYLNVEQPPFTKSLYGIFEHLFGNPYYLSYVFYLLSIVCIFYLTQLVFKDRLIGWVSTLLFALNPLTVYQVEQTMLDLPLTIFLMIHIICLFKINNSKNKTLMAILTGLSLGLVAGAKIGYYVPAIAIVDIYFFYITKYKKYIPHLIIFGVAGYILSWYIYFIRHPNPIPWIRLHQNIINFYSGSHLPLDFLNIIKTIILNQYFQWAVTPTKIIPMVEWSVLLPIGLVLTLFNLYKIKYFIKQNILIAYLTLLCAILLIMEGIIPFWPRYLMIIIPFFSIFVSRFVSKSKLSYLLLFLLYIPPLMTILQLRG